MIDYEIAVLANMLVFNRVINDVVQIVDESCFTKSENKKAYRNIVSIYGELGLVDQVHLSQKMSPSFCSKLVSTATIARSTTSYAKKIREASLIERALEFAEQIKLDSKRGREDVRGFLAYVAQHSAVLYEESEDKHGSSVGAKTMLNSIAAEIERNKDQDTIGIGTGFKELDDLTGGVQRGHLTVVGAYTSVGKTAFAIQLMVSMLKTGKACVMLSNEMTATQIGLRILGLLSGIPSLKIQHGRGLSDGEVTALERAKEDFATYRLTVIESMHEREKVLATIRNHADADVIFVDYLGQISSEEKSEYEQMTRVSREIQAAAMQCGVPIVALSQVSNESAKALSSPVLGYKGSGNIAAAADVGIELHRDKDNDPTLLKVHVRKNRHGATGSFNTEFDVRTGRIKAVFEGIK